MNRKQALELIRNKIGNNKQLLDAIGLVIETADPQGDFNFNGEDSVWEDSVSGTLNTLASEIRNLCQNSPQQT